MNLYVGTSGFQYPPWRGKFYPAKLPKVQMLRYYAEHFRAVERNDTFRTFPTASAVETWIKDVPSEFQLAIKAPQRVTHIERLKDCGELVTPFFAALDTLKKRLGPVLFQLPPNFKKDVPRLRDFLKHLPRRRRVAFEFRHESWFDDEVFSLLRRNRIALCIAEEKDELRVPFVATADWGYLRLRRDDYGDKSLKKWLTQIREQDWRDAFVFFKHEDEARGPKLAKRMLKLARQ